ncbi:winged helix-turn-helix domain-containing protein [Candidatus Peregrinibacteria bacterium]|nr:winged helix-turn-helix domain-containing protein [Candidatus Peregrinibacteria bacterium]
MDLLPSSVESYLQEAGFSGTELFVLKRLMEDDAMTLREMAIKTGKSTGVLDQAVKKLIKKGIVDRTDVNGHPKYGLHSLNAVREWMEEDMQHKQDMLLRKQRNFDAFITSLAKDKERPEMEHFDGIEGIKQAYMALLEKDTKEFLMYVPVTCKEEDDELRDFRVQYFRERRRRGIFSRVLAHDTPLGNRYRNRDPFEYRKTILLPQDEYPFTFEQIIAGNTIACFNHLIFLFGQS